MRLLAAFSAAVSGFLGSAVIAAWLGVDSRALGIAQVRDPKTDEFMYEVLAIAWPPLRWYAFAAAVVWGVLLWYLIGLASRRCAGSSEGGPSSAQSAPTN